MMLYGAVQMFKSISYSMLVYSTQLWSVFYCFSCSNDVVSKFYGKEGGKQKGNFSLVWLQHASVLTQNVLQFENCLPCSICSANSDEANVAMCIDSAKCKLTLLHVGF